MSFGSSRILILLRVGQQPQQKSYFAGDHVVCTPRKLIWASWTIQPGQKLTTRPELNFACREVMNYAEPKKRRIVGHNESEGIQQNVLGTISPKLS